jgi:phosphate transport system substrate-binding protein
METKNSPVRMLPRLVAAALAIVLLAAACGGGDTPGSGGGQALTGEIVISGSSTVEPISALVAELFNEENPDVAISVDGPGTGDGFELFCSGQTDISDASRPINEEEVAACEQEGVNYVELEVAFDGITVLTSPENTAVTCLDTKDLYALLGPESQGFANWSDADTLATAIGAGHAPYPDMALDVTAPGEESGTYDAFVELALGDVIEERGAEEATRPDYQSSPNDNVIIEGIAAAPGSLGWVGFSFYEANTEVVKAIEVDGGEGCVAPNRDTIADGSYPLSRSLFIYVNTDKAAQNPALKSYVDFYLTNDGLGTGVEEAGYVDLPADRIEATRAAWEVAAV